MSDTVRKGEDRKRKETGATKTEGSRGQMRSRTVSRRPDRKALLPSGRCRVLLINPWMHCKINALYN